MSTSSENQNKEVGPYRLQSTREIYRSPWLQLREDRVLRPDGAPGVFGIITMREGSSILPLDKNDQVYLVREFKYGIGEYSLEVISGGFDKGETPLAAAQRELAEETGLAATDWLNLGCVHPFTTVVYSPNHIFLARGLQQGWDRPDAGEQLSVEKLPFSQALDLVMTGKIIHAASCVVILKAARVLGV